MEPFKQFINTIFRKSITFTDIFNERIITFNNKVYPKFGNVVILAGGAGSGKGFVTSNLIGLEGKILDVDNLKKIALKAPKFRQKVKKETGHDIKDLDLKNPENVSLLHRIVGITFGIPKKQQQTLIAGILTKDKNRKPNIIFDVTLKNITKLHNITSMLEDAGYDKKHIHIVWVINKVDVAWKHNLTRDRVVPKDIFMDTHRGAALTMKNIIDSGSKLKQYMDGDFWLAFNKVGTEAANWKDGDAEVKKSANGGGYIKTADFINIKKAGKQITSSKDISQRILDKIKEYVPKSDNW